MDGNSEEYAVSESCRYPKSSAYPESVKKRMDEDGDTCDERDMIIVLMWILVGVIPVFVIVLPSGEKLFYEVDDQKACHKGIDGEPSGFERFGQYVHERYREHRSGPECDEEIQNCPVYFLEKIQKYSRCRDEEKYNEREEEVHKWNPK